jgi:FixJ family two-component response regulator
MAVQAMRKGAYDFIEKPFDDEQLLNQVSVKTAEFHRARIMQKLGVRTAG